MARAITYYYPDESAPSSLKVFQDRSSQIRGFYFTRDRLEDIVEVENAGNYAIYFLLGNDDDEHPISTIYVGQSKNGAGRIIDHKYKKTFWSHCIMFVSDNNAFEAGFQAYVVGGAVRDLLLGVEPKDFDIPKLPNTFFPAKIFSNSKKISLAFIKKYMQGLLIIVIDIHDKGFICLNSF